MPAPVPSRRSCQSDRGSRAERILKVIFLKHIRGNLQSLSVRTNHCRLNSCLSKISSKGSRSMLESCTSVGLGLGGQMGVSGQGENWGDAFCCLPAACPIYCCNKPHKKSLSLLYKLWDASSVFNRDFSCLPFFPPSSSLQVQMCLPCNGLSLYYPKIMPLY